jgi:hypothetical protein
MTTQEFSNAFDTLLNSYRDIKEFGKANSAYSLELDEYEKSILLTQAQDMIVKSYFDRSLNPQGQGFDDTERRQIDFSELIKVNEPTLQDPQSTTYDDRGILYEMPVDILFMLNEKIVSTTGVDPNEVTKSYIVVPLNYKEYDRLMSKAFAQPLKKQAWRLFQTPTGVDMLSELIPIYGVPITSYKIRYVRRPLPIVLADLSSGEYAGGLDIDGVSTVSECELNKVVHMDILNKAVELALSRVGVGTPTRRQDNQD